jgi:hypothetical protein
MSEQVRRLRKVLDSVRSHDFPDPMTPANSRELASISEEHTGLIKALGEATNALEARQQEREALEKYVWWVREDESRAGQFEEWLAALNTEADDE